ncbi:MAG TPA: ThiF family adenylyltransferase [Dissulfurispiraceae bacterium]|nr:ThiF family adenylyltransferase [Dissulfurispiraceae bacterium]
MQADRLIEEEFNRNLGLLTAEQQRQLLGMQVAIAGVGGVGGIHALTLARIGIGGFTVADPDTFEAPNINRQYACFRSTFGKNKAGVLAAMLHDINPEAAVRAMPCAITRENVDAFLEGADVFVDGVDFFEIDLRRLIFRRCYEKGIYAITSAPLGFGATLQVFSPQGMTFDDYFGMNDTMPHLDKLAAFAVGLAPNPYHIKYMDLSRVSLTRKTGPALALACTLAASLVATEVIKLGTGKGEVRAVPHYTQIDLLQNKFKSGCVPLGGKNPLQRLKKWIVLRKALAAEKQAKE